MRLLSIVGAWLLAAAALAADTAGLRLNQLQVIGTHNSYKQAIQPELLARIRMISVQADMLDYSHAPLADQLDLGLRSLEIDLLHDPQGGLYAEPKGQALLRELGETPAPHDPLGLLDSPGFKVMHSPDIDFRSHCLTFDEALATLRDWSLRHPDHLPIIVIVNLKEKADPFPGATVPASFDRSAMDALDAAIRNGLGVARLLTPDRVRNGHATLEGAVRTGGWPLIDEVRGTFLWVLDETGAKHDRYLDGHPSLAGRVLFSTSPPGNPEAAFLVINDPIRHGDQIRRRAEEGYLVRTRADAGTREARRGDRSRFDAAMASRAHVISTDYPRPDKRLGTGYSVSFGEGVYSRVQPDAARLKAPR